MNHEGIKQALIAKYDTAVWNFQDSFGILCFNTSAENLKPLVRYIYEDDSFAFRFLTDITAVHYPDKKDSEICVIYHLHNLVENVRIRISVDLPIANPNVSSLTAIHSGANWMERETYDFFGVNFLEHPNLVRILNVDEMNYFPMRKEYPMEDPTRIDKDDHMFGRS